MSNERDDGGSAFPQVESQHVGSQGEYHTEVFSAGSMTLRDYFVAHAPAEPQPWFRPVMPEAPDVPQWRDAPDAVQAELIHPDYEDWLDPKEMSAEAREWHEARERADKARKAWSKELDKQRYVQWPAAWADEMLKARQS